MTASGDADARAWSFPPSPKLSRLFPRITTAEETQARIQPLLSRIPVTRVADLSGLDPLGLPVWTAVTPLARDLTTHLGKGMDAAAARASALMEAVERTSVERLPSPGRRASAEQLTAPLIALDPRSFDLPSDTAFREDVAITWTAGWDLLEEQEVWLPADLVLNPPAEGVLRDVDTNGLAAGNSLLEAVLHGLCEVIERDAVSQHLFCAMFLPAGTSNGGPRARVLDLTTLPPSLGTWLDRLRAENLSLAVADLTTEIGIPIFKAVLVDHEYPGVEGLRPRLFMGFGCDPCSEVALRRALTEAIQSRVGVIQAARDSFNAIPLGAHPATWQLANRELEPGERVPFSAVVSHESEDLLQDLQVILAGLRRAGFRRAVAVDLTRSDLKIPVVRVRVPGLASFVGNRRRAGWRCLRHLL